MFTRERYFLGLAIIIPAGFCLIYLSLDSIISTPEKIIIPPAPMVGNRPAGEIIKGFEITQTLLLSKEKAELIRELQKSQDKLCLSLFLANYSNRVNKGSIELTLQQKETVFEHVIDMSSVKDNAFHEVCFSSGNFSGISAGDLVIKLAGLDGAPGSSITAWLTSDTKQGVAFINGVNSGKALRFAMAIQEDYSLVNYSAIALLVVYLVSLSFVAFLFVIVDKKGANRDIRGTENEAYHSDPLL